MKKVIKIFLASSITEFAAERNELEVFIRNMSDVYEEQYDIKIKPVRCEQIDPYVTDSRTQDIINESLAECEMCFILVYTRFGEFSYEEFRHALKKFRESAEHLPKIYVYFKQLGEGERADASVTEFMSELNDSLKHYYGTFKNIDTVKLRIALNFVAQKLDISSVELEEGRVAINGVKMEGLELENVSEFLNSRALTEQKEKLSQLDSEYYPLHVRFKRGELLKDSAELEKYTLLASKRAKLKAEIEQTENEIFEFSVRRSRDEVGGFVSDRHRMAYTLFEEGDLEGACEVLDEDEIETDYRARKARIIARKMEELRRSAEVYIKEIKTKIDILIMLATGRKWMENRLSAIRLYEKLLPEAEENLTCLYIFREYAEFMLDMSKSLYDGEEGARLEAALDSALTLRDLYEENPEHATLENVGLINLTLGRIYLYKASKTTPNWREVGASPYIGEALAALRVAEESLSALAIRSPEKYNSDICLTFKTIGKIYELKGDFIKAEQYYVKPTKLYINGSKRQNEKMKRVVAENYLAMNTLETVIKAKELFEELYASDPKYRKDLARCFRQLSACHKARDDRKSIDYPAPICEPLERATENILSAIALEEAAPPEEKLESYERLAEDWGTLASYYYRKFGDFKDNPDQTAALNKRAEYLASLFALSDGDGRINIVNDLIDIYKQFTEGTIFSVDEPFYSDGPVNNADERKRYNEHYKKWMRELRTLEGNPDLISGIEDHEPNPTHDEVKLEKERLKAEERAKKELESKKAYRTSWGFDSGELSYSSIEEGILAYARESIASSYQFERLKKLISDNLDSVAPSVLSSAALKLIRTDVSIACCVDYAVWLCEQATLRDSGLIDDLGSVYYLANQHYAEYDREKWRSFNNEEELLRFAESLPSSEKLDDKLLLLYDKRINALITWYPDGYVEKVRVLCEKKIAILKKYPEDISRVRNVASAYQLLSQIMGLNGDHAEQLRYLDLAEASLIAYMETEGESSACYGIANVFMERCRMHKKRGELDSAAEAALGALKYRKRGYDVGYKSIRNAEILRDGYEEVKDLMPRFPKDILAVMLSDYIDFAVICYEEKFSKLYLNESKLYLNEYVEKFDLAISILSDADNASAAAKIAERKLVKMKELLQRFGLENINNVKNTLQKLIELNEILGDNQKADEWRSELSSITA
ncbi:MAG: hypothetical protein IJE25_04565 [Clostridia bacterium]|nr:hypothetical protein [Clostridia bacterium]